jgi:hypothetical protein
VEGNRDLIFAFSEISHPSRLTALYRRCSYEYYYYETYEHRYYYPLEKNLCLVFFILARNGHSRPGGHNTSTNVVAHTSTRYFHACS